MSKPSEEAMLAARKAMEALGFESNGVRIVHIADALDAFAETARKDERESIRGWLETYAGTSVVRQFDEDNERLDAKQADRG